MIKANELRIGNLFYKSYGGYKVVAEIHKYTVDATAIGFSVIVRYDLDSIEPIPLTEQVLLDCGLEQIKGTKIYSINDAYKLKIIENSGFSNSCLLYKKYVGNLIVSITYVSYLHELQNLCFALTSQELQYKV